MRVEKLLPPTALVNHPACLSGRRAYPPEEVGGPYGYDQRMLDQFNWSYEAPTQTPNTPPVGEKLQPFFQLTARQKVPLSFPDETRTPLPK